MLDCDSKESVAVFIVISVEFTGGCEIKADCRSFAANGISRAFDNGIDKSE